MKFTGTLLSVVQVPKHTPVPVLKQLEAFFWETSNQNISLGSIPVFENNEYIWIRIQILLVHNAALNTCSR
jgi:hypothetical protein